MNTSAPEYPHILASREPEMVQMSSVADAHSRVRRYFAALLENGCYCLTIAGKPVLLEGPADVDRAFQRYLSAPEENQRHRQRQASVYVKDGKLVA